MEVSDFTAMAVVYSGVEMSGGLNFASVLPLVNISCLCSSTSFSARMLTLAVRTSVERPGNLLVLSSYWSSGTALIFLRLQPMLGRQPHNGLKVNAKLQGRSPRTKSLQTKGSQVMHVLCVKCGEAVLCSRCSPHLSLPLGLLAFQYSNSKTL